jgi:hypothetical protein
LREVAVVDGAATLELPATSLSVVSLAPPG